MVFWIILAISLNFILLMSIYNGAGQDSILAIAYSILLVALGVLYRSFIKYKEGKLETLDEKCSRLTKENEKLKQKIGYYEAEFGSDKPVETK
ncbi:hypothetical protein JW877_08625 [bacterium]|nr:hypothetical protein [bacterium]